MNIQAPVPAGFRRAERLAAIGVSEILKITAEAAARRHAGHPVISLGAGEPDFDTPAHIKDAAVGAIRAGATKYTALDGSPDLKEAVRGKFRRENHLSFSLAEITCASGAKQIIYNALMATLDPGDQVIIPAPYWTSYVDIVTICGGQPVICSCGEANDFKLRPEDLARIVTPRSRWLILNSPGNPSGSAYTGPELLALAGELERHPGLWVLSDDIYEHIVYDGFAFTTLAEVAPQLSGRILTVNGISKAYAMTGWRLGYAGGPRALIHAMAVVQSQSTSCPSSVSQAAAIAALTGPQDIVRERTQAFQRRRDLVVDSLNRIPGLTCRRPAGAFYVFAGCAGVLNWVTPHGEIIANDDAFCRYLLKHSNVAVITGSCFGVSPYFRISYAASDDDLREACERIGSAVAALSRGPCA